MRDRHHHRFELTASDEGLAQLLDAVEQLVGSHAAIEGLGGDVRLMAEEALTNVIKYAYEGPPPATIAEVLVSLDVEEVLLEIRDRGRAFDPLGQRAPELDAPMEEKTEGGLGIHLLRKLADELHYRRERQTNVLLIKKRFG